jgi:hypothetical protein
MGEVKMNGKLTLAQSAFLEANSHLVPVERLSDGDLLCLDRGKWRVEPGDPLYGEHFGPYILTTDGCVQTVTSHYQRRHGVSI